jgi:hypothetical protein
MWSKMRGLALPFGSAGKDRGASERLRQTAVVAAFGLTVLGSKLMVIGRFGSSTPFWDQWDAEAANLYVPYLRGMLRFEDLFLAHNEHRIFFTRLISLAQLELVGSWSPQLQMVVNAALHVAFLVALLLVIRPERLGSRSLLPLCLFAALIFGMPFAYQNTLGGFQSQFYILLILALLSLHLCGRNPALQAKWLLGLLLGGLSWLAMASGALTLIAVGGLALAQIVAGVRSGVKEWVGVAVLLAVGAVLIVLTPSVPFHAQYRANDAAEFFQAFAAGAAWPLPPILFLGFIILQAPALVLTWTLWQTRQQGTLSNRAWLIVAVALWVGLQLAAAAYARSGQIVGSRYLDIYMIGIVAQFAALLMLLARHRRGSARPLVNLFALAWMLLVTASYVTRSAYRLPELLTELNALERVQTANLKRFIASGDRTALLAQPPELLPYPEPARLAEIASSPELRSILPDPLVEPLPPRDYAYRRLALGGGLRLGFGGLAENLRLIGAFLFALGTALWIGMLSVRMTAPRSPGSRAQLRPGARSRVARTGWDEMDDETVFQLPSQGS